MILLTSRIRFSVMFYNGMWSRPLHFLKQGELALEMSGPEKALDIVLSPKWLLELA